MTTPPYVPPFQRPPRTTTHPGLQAATIVLACLPLAFTADVVLDMLATNLGLLSSSTGSLVVEIVLSALVGAVMAGPVLLIRPGPAIPFVLGALVVPVALVGDLAYGTAHGIITTAIPHTSDVSAYWGHFFGRMPVVGWLAYLVSVTVAVLLAGHRTRRMRPAVRTAS